ncbi:MAG: hypothetical protein OQK05_10190 [Pseudopelagicola sp.]|nr:hypothetical protein [Pseudopelagicola sp.]
MRALFSIALCLATLPLRAEVVPVPYKALAATLDQRQDFETLPHRGEPGFNLDHTLRSAGLSIGTHFQGQSLIPAPGPTGAPHDALGPGDATRPLALKTDPRGQNLSIAFHRGFGSNALLPLGPHGFDRLSGRGEGAVAVLFDADQSAIALRLHTDYATALAAPRRQGTVTLRFYDRTGRRIGVQTLRPGPSITELGFRTKQDRPRIAGLLVTNLDPGGIALDDILFQIVQRLF